jgi:hypothetical protein
LPYLYQAATDELGLVLVDELIERQIRHEQSIRQHHGS